MALFAALALTTASQAAPVAEPEAEPEASASGQTVFICDIRSDGTMACVTIQGELDICARLPAGVIRRSYLADPEQQPSVVVPTAEDIDEAIRGTTSGDQGSIADVQEIYGPGEGVLDIVPAEQEDQFSEPSEQFQIGGVYKGDFTTTWQTCNALGAGQELTVFPGGFFSDIDLASQEMLDTQRNLLLVITLAAEGAQIDPQLVTAAPSILGPDGEGQLGGIGTSDGGTGDTSPPTLPPVGADSGGGAEEAIVPNVLGLTLPAATAEIIGEGFIVGTVIIQTAAARPPGGLFIGSAHAFEEPTVVDQKPDGGLSIAIGSVIDLVMSGPLFPISEPSSLMLLIVGLALLAMLMWVIRPRT